jgi:hypothetical protein
MPGASDYTRNNVLNGILRGAAIPVPTHTYVSLHTGAPGVNGANEVLTANWPAYVRRQAENNLAIGAGWTAAASGQTKNALQMTWPAQDGAGAVTVSHFGIWDALSGGNLIAYGTLTTPQLLGPGDVLVFDVQTLTVTMT